MARALQGLFDELTSFRLCCHEAFVLRQLLKKSPDDEVASDLSRDTETMVTALRSLSGSGFRPDDRMEASVSLA